MAAGHRRRRRAASLTAASTARPWLRPGTKHHQSAKAPATALACNALASKEPVMRSPPPPPATPRHRQEQLKLAARGLRTLAVFVLVAVLAGPMLSSALIASPWKAT